MEPDGIQVDVYNSVGEEWVDVVGSVAEYFRAGKNAGGMEGQCDRANLKR